MLDGIDARVRMADDIPTVGGHRHAEPVRFVDCDLRQVQRKKLIDLENVAAELLLALHRSAHFFRRGDDDVVAGGSRAKGIVPGADAADRPPRHPNPRPADFPQSGPLFLRQSPRAVLVELDIGAGGNSQMKIELAMKILQVAMSIDESRQNGLAMHVDDLSAGGNSEFAAPADSLEPACLDDNHGILDRRPAGPVNQFSTLHHKYLLCHICFSSVLPISGLRRERIFLLTLPAGHLSCINPQGKVFDERFDCQRAIGDDHLGNVPGLGNQGQVHTADRGSACQAINQLGISRSGYGPRSRPKGMFNPLWKPQQVCARSKLRGI